MTMSDRYDAFYRTALTREQFVDVSVKGWPSNRREAILAHAGRGHAVLDVGCGNGQLLYQLRARFEQLVGIEYSAHRPEQARVNPKAFRSPRFKAALRRWMTQIASDSIDCVVSADTIEHVPEVYAAAAELRRVLKPGASSSSTRRMWHSPRSD